MKSLRNVVVGIGVVALIVGLSGPAGGEENAPDRRVVTFETSMTEVNVVGKPETWYGTAMREDIGAVHDSVNVSADLHKTFPAHEGRRAKLVDSLRPCSTAAEKCGPSPRPVPSQPATNATKHRSREPSPCLGRQLLVAFDTC